jgi:hypothetical protein
MVRVDAETAKLETNIAGSTPAAIPDGAGGLDFTTREINALGQVTLRGIPGEPCAGWALGFFQLEFVETNRAGYRGTTRADGSVLVVRDRPPARARQLCRDTGSTTVPPAFWYNPPAGALGHTEDTTMMVLPPGATIPATGAQILAATFYDCPAENYPLVQVNSLFVPPRPNSLYSVTIGFAFCTVLAVQDPGGVYQFLKHFYWNCRWRAHFGPGGGITVTGSNIMDLNVQRHVHSGVPTDPHFNRASLLEVTLPTCNALANAAAAAPLVTPSLTWT